MIFITSLDMNGTYTIIGETSTQSGVLTGKLSPFPGSKQLMVSHALWVYPAARGNGYSKEYFAFISKLAKSKGCRALLASVRTDNRTQHARLEQLGWLKLSNTLWMVKL